MEKKTARQMRQAAWNQSIGYVVGAFGLVAGLAWNDAVQSFIKEVFPVAASSLIIKFVYAIVITVVVVLVTSWLRKIEQKDEE